MNLVLVHPAELDGDACFSLFGDRAEHVRCVIGAVPGQELRAGIARGSLGIATLLEAREGECRLEFRATGEPTPQPTEDLAIGVPRPKVIGRVVEMAAMMGVGRIDLINAWRVDKAYFGSPRLADEALAEAARRGCEQGGHTWLPDIHVHRRFMSFCDGLPSNDERARVVAHPSADAMITQLDAALDGRMVLAVGPEGGWIERELVTLRDLGFTALRLSARVLRSEAAVIAALAQIELARASGSST